MNAKILAPLALVAALLGTASSASAAWVYFGPVYRPVPVYQPVYQPVPVYRPVPVAYQPYAAADRVQGRVTAFNLFDMTLAVGGNLIPVRLHQ
ncbi:MAG: hypothetical protein JO092_09425, partial [Candidatus Eremiobacteraeota bacterium]|nr:hypothetical protein [Candidatus Eremiobacteraeota bacterium]